MKIYMVSLLHRATIKTVNSKFYWLMIKIMLRDHNHGVLSQPWQTSCFLQSATVMPDKIFPHICSKTVFVPCHVTAVPDLVHLSRPCRTGSVCLWCRDHSDEWQGWSFYRRSPGRVSAASSRLQTSFCWLSCTLRRVRCLSCTLLILLTLSPAITFQYFCSDFHKSFPPLTIVLPQDCLNDCDSDQICFVNQVLVLFFCYCSVSFSVQ